MFYDYSHLDLEIFSCRHQGGERGGGHGAFLLFSNQDLEGPIFEPRAKAAAIFRLTLFPGNGDSQK